MYREIFERQNLPPLPVDEEVLNVRYLMGTTDWYCETKSGWWWLDGISKKAWMRTPLGPIQ